MKIGDWYTYCCELDLTQIMDEVELQEIQDAVNDEDFEWKQFPKVWGTKKEALRELTEG